MSIIGRIDIRPGSIIHVFCDFVDPPKIKYLVVAYINIEKDESLVFIVNSEIPQFIANDKHHLSRQLKLAQEPLYKFFTHDSYMNCMEVWDCLDLPKTLEFLLEFPEEHCGYLSPEECKLVASLVKDAQTISNIDKEIVIRSLTQ